MRKQYDDFTQMKTKDMCKSISDMTYMYINPETGEPTKVPPVHYEKILNQVAEKYISEETSRQFLTIMYNQLTSLKKEDEKYFNQALLCMDLGINPKDLRIDEQIALEDTYFFLTEKQRKEGKNFHVLDTDYVNAFNEAKNNPELQSNIIRMSNERERMESNYNNHHHNYGRDER